MAFRLLKVSSCVETEGIVALEVMAKASTVGNVNNMEPIEVLTMDFNKTIKKLKEDRRAEFPVQLIISKQLLKDILKGLGD